MAIVKTVFTGTTLATNEPEVLAFLQANAADFFDSITATDNVISCVLDSVTVLKLSFNGTDKTAISLLNGVSVEVYNASANERFGAGYKTDYGILLETVNNGTFYIFKDNQSKAGLIATMKTTSTQYQLYIGALEANQSWFNNSSNNGSTPSQARQKYMVNSAAALTSLTPLPLGNGGTYAPNLLITAFSENGYLSTIKKLVVNDIDYVYDGLFALRA